MLFYEGIGSVVENPDMGMAVIALSLVVRLMTLPLSLRSRSTEEDKDRIGRFYNDLKRRYKDSDPLKYKEEKAELVRSEQRMIRSEMVNLGIQIFIAIMLWRVFSTGLRGEDLHLLYSWVPLPHLPFNLTFLGSIDLSHPNFQLNILIAVLMFLLETLRLMFTPFEPTTNDRFMQIIVPVGVFIYLYSMPSGKKLFVITSLVFSIALTLLLEGWDLFVLARKKEA